MDAMERRKRLYELAESDPEYRRIRAEYEKAKEGFDRFTLTLPEQQRNLLQTCPGMGYFLHHRMLSIVCENMAFPDERNGKCIVGDGFPVPK